MMFTLLLLPFPKKLVLGPQNKQDHSQCSKNFKTNFTGQQVYFYYKNKWFISCDYPGFWISAVSELVHGEIKV